MGRFAIFFWFTGRCRTNFVCQNGGFIGPNCNCICPYGISGFTCDEVAKSTPSEYFNHFQINLFYKLFIPTILFRSIVLSLKKPLSFFSTLFHSLTFKIAGEHCEEKTAQSFPQIIPTTTTVTLNAIGWSK